MRDPPPLYCRSASEITYFRLPLVSSVLELVVNTVANTCVLIIIALMLIDSIRSISLGRHQDS